MRSSVVTIPPRAAVRPRLAHARTVALIATQLAFVAALLWFCLPQALGGRAGWVLVSGTSMLPHLHTGDLVLVEHRSSYHVGEVVAYRIPKGQVGSGHVVIRILHMPVLLGLFAAFGAFFLIAFGRDGEADADERGEAG